MARKVEVRYGERDAREIIETVRRENPGLLEGAELNLRVKASYAFEGKDKGQLLEPGTAMVIEPPPHDVETVLQITDQKGKARTVTEVRIPGTLGRLSIPRMPIRIDHGGHEITIVQYPPSAVVLHRGGHEFVVGKQIAYHKDAQTPMGHMDKGAHIIAVEEAGKLILHNIGKHPVKVRLVPKLRE